MHIVMLTAIGLLVLAVIYGITTLLGREGSSRIVARASGFFCLLWLGVSAVDFYLGVAKTGFSLTTEIASHAVIFGVPAIACLALAIRASRRDPARPA